jgi:hypothetical protein
MIPLYYGTNRRVPIYDNFNYFASQCRIRIEMAFGMMTQKWRILLRPLLQKFENVRLFALTIARLHNFCIDQRLSERGWNPASRCAALGVRAQEISDGNERSDGFITQHAADMDANTFQYVIGGSFMRQTMADRVQNKDLQRPLTSVLHTNYVANLI